MDYFKNKAKAYNELRFIVKQEKEIELTSLFVHFNSIYGLGRLFVMRTLKELEEFGELSIEKDKVISLLPQTDGNNKPADVKAEKEKHKEVKPENDTKTNNNS